MMKPLFYCVVTTCFIVLQTTILPGFSFFNQCFDTLIVIVICISLCSFHPVLIPGIIFLGCIMDSISGGAFGLYISAYIWIYIIVQLLKRFVHSENILFLVAMSALAVLLENGFLFFSFIVKQGVNALSSQDLVVMGKQLFWAFFIVPVLIMIFHICERRFTAFGNKMMNKNM